VGRGTVPDMPAVSLPVTGNAEANKLLVDDPLALIIGMLLDQQVPMEWAFASPLTLRERMGGRLDAATIAATDPAELEAMFKGPPALHRFPGSMAKRTQALCQVIVDDYDGDTANIWAGVDSGKELLARVKALPGFGVEKSKIFTAMLAKRFGIAPDGWQQATHPFSDGEPRSVADIGSREEFDRVRAWKKMMRAEKRAKSDPAP
jgi:uncharacterized HhH-GPD family protein